MRAAEPAELAATFERGVPVPDGRGDRFAGYAVLGVAFAGGDVLALRRFPVCSAGRGYTSVWHCSPEGRWTFYADVPERQGCAAYFGPALDEVAVVPIRLEWRGPRSLVVAVAGGRVLTWSVHLAPTRATRLFNRMGPRAAPIVASRPRLAEWLALAARLALRAGGLRLAGRTPSGVRFLGVPEALWIVRSSRASIGDRDVGSSVGLQRPLALGDFRIPSRGLFAASYTFMIPEEP